MYISLDLLLYHFSETEEILKARKIDRKSQNMIKLQLYPFLYILY